MSATYRPLQYIAATTAGMMLFAFAGWAALARSPEPALPETSTRAPSDVERVAAELAALRARNTATADALTAAADRVDDLEEEWRAVGRAEATRDDAKADRAPRSKSKPKPKARPKARPGPKDPRPTQHRPIIWEDEGEGPLANIR